MRRLLLVSLLIWPLFAGAASAEEPRRLVDGFGPQAFTSGQSTATFGVPSTRGRWFLTVQRSSNSQPRARVKLNGQTVIRPGDFRLGQRVLRVAVDVQQANTLQVRVFGPGQLNVQVQGVVKEAQLPAGVGQRVAKTTVYTKRFFSPGFAFQHDQVDADQPGLYTLQLTNGRRNGSRRVWWATVFWNQELPFGFWSLNSSTRRAEAPVIPLPNNQLGVLSFGSWNSYLVVRLKGWVVDEDAPTVAWTDPAAGSEPQPGDLLRVTYADPNSGVDTGSVLIELNGTDVTAAFDVQADEATATLADLPAGALVQGANTLTATVLDRACNEAQASVSFQQGGAPAPTLSLPGDLTRECNGAAGTAVQFTVSATDPNDPNPTVVCTPPSGSSFPLGSTTVTCTATNAGGQSSSAQFTVTVVDTTPPALGQNAAVFGTNPAPAPGAGPGALALGDLNGDGNRDLVVAQAGGLGVFLGDGSGGFGARVDVAAAAFSQLALGDLDGDGDLDLAGLDPAGQVVRLLGDGAGGLGSPAATAVGANPQRLALADLDGDGDLDVAVSAQGANAVSVLTNDGAGGFAASAVAAGSAPLGVAAVDLDVDGAVDLLVSAAGEVRLLRNTGAGYAAPVAFAAGTTPVDLLVGDFNRDGWPDVAAADPDAGAVLVLLGDGVGLGAAASTAVGAQPERLGAFDAEGDGDLDLAATSSGASLSLLVGDGAGGFSASALGVGGSSAALAAGDLNGDGRPDLVATQGAGLALLLGDAGVASVTAEATGPGGATVSYANPAARDACDPAPALSCAPASGATFPLGTSAVTCTATDASGNTSALSFDVVVQDTTAPVVTPSADLVVEQTSPGGAVVSYAVSASDAVDPAPTLACTPASGSLFAPGVTTVTCTATDAAGNTSAPVTFTVTVQDTTAPALSQPADVVVEQVSAAGTNVNYAAPTATDAADPAPTVVCVPASGSLFPAGTTTVTCTATDAAGNSSQVTFTVTVQDTTAPTLTQPADVIVEQTAPAGNVVSYAAPTASDAVDPAPTVVCVPPSGSLFPGGVTTVTCTATDAAGNSSQVTFTVTVQDTTAPTLSQPADVVAEQTSPAGATVSFGLPSASDAVDPAPTVVSVPPSGSLFAPGVTTVTCTATDASGNSSQVTFTVTVQDTTAPTLIQPGDLVVEQAGPAGTAVNYAAPLVSDAADPAPTVVCAPASGSVFPAGVTTVTCTATDASGNSSQVTFTVTVQDTTAPALSQPADLVVEQAGPAGTAVSYAAPAASDAVDPAPTVVCVPPSGSVFPGGVTTVSCTATDAAGNSSQVTFTVTVQDTTAPTLTQPADVVVEWAAPAGTAVSYAAPSASDTVDPAPTVVCVPPSGSVFPGGVTTVTCTATDAAGNSAQVTFTVTVQDTIAPTLGQTPDLVVEQTNPAGAVVTFGGPPASDAADPNPTVTSVPASGTAFPPGVTTVTCIATDASGNVSAPITFTVTVQDTIAPSLSLVPPDGATVNLNQVPLSASYADSGSGVDLASFSALLDGTDVTAQFTVGANDATASVSLAAGSHTLQVTVVDVAGNPTVVSSTFTVTAGADTDPPVVAFVSPPDQGCVGPQTPVEFTYSDPGSGVDLSSVTVLLNGTDVSASFTVGAGSAIAPLGSLTGAVEGPGNTLQVSVSDTAGNTATLSSGFDYDATPPALAVAPVDGASVDPDNLQLVADYSDAGCAIDQGSFRAFLDGVEISSSFAIGPTQAVATAPPLSDGQHTLEVRIRDIALNETVVSSTFTVVAIPADFELALTPGDPQAGVEVTSSNDLVLRAVRPNGNTATSFVGFVLFSTSDGLAPLDGFVAEFTAGDQGQITLSGLGVFRTLGTVVVTAQSLEAPPNDISGSLPVNVGVVTPLVVPAPPPTLGVDGVLEVTGYSYPGEVVELVIDGVVVATATVGSNGTYAFTELLQPGAHTVKVQAVDPSSGSVVMSSESTVTAPIPPTIGISVTPLASTLAVGQSEALSVQQLFASGAVADVTDAATYQSSDVGVATVTSMGVIDAVAPGSATVDVDFGGFQTTVQVVVGVPVLESSSPTPGEDGVAVTRETILRFSAPLQAASVTAAAVFAVDAAGDPIPSRLQLSQDERRITVFYDDPLPASTRVRVTVDGGLLLAQAGAVPVDADADGTPGGVAVIEFETLSLTSLPGTAVCGRVFASELDTQGGGSVNVPLEGVTVTVDGAEGTWNAVTDALGDFRLDPAPVGRFFVHIDGRTAVNGVPAGAYYPFVGKTWDAKPGQETKIGNVFLPLIQPGVLQPVSLTQATTLGFTPDVIADFPELSGTQITVPADSLYADDGTRGGSVGIAPVPPDRLPGTLPDGLTAAVVFTVQTSGATNFDVPVAVRFPNLDNLPPGTKSALWSFNHDTGRFEISGSMTVSADGLWVETDPGEGIQAPGWHLVNPGSTITGGPMTRAPDPAPRPCPEPDPGNPQETRAGPGKDSDATCVHGCETPPAKSYIDRLINPLTPNVHVAPTGAAPGVSLVADTGEMRLTRSDSGVRGRLCGTYYHQRKFRTRTTYEGPMGQGWFHNYEIALFPEPSGDVKLHDGTGFVITYTRNPDGSYTSPPGFFDTLIQDPTDGSFEVCAPDGSVTCFAPTGEVTSQADPEGNSLQFVHDVLGNLELVIDSYGREYRYGYSTTLAGHYRLTSLTDFSGRTVTYDYDANGYLSTVTTPAITGTSTGNDYAQGRTERYVYSSGFADSRLNGNLLQVIYPQQEATTGAAAATYTYGTNPADPMSFDRVLSETLGDGVVVGGTTTFTYEELNAGVPLGDLSVVRGRTTVTERNGNVYEYYSNELNHHILSRRITQGFRPGEPAFYETTREFDADGQLTRIVYPEGNETRYVYASGSRAAQQNVIEVRQIAGPRGDGSASPTADLVTTFTYEPVYNKVATITDPRGNAAGFVPPLASGMADRYVTKFFYDYQEGTGPVPAAVKLGIDLSGVPRGLGDINSDGVTDQVAGNQIRIEAPTVELRSDSNEAAVRGTTEQAVITEIQYNARGQVVKVIDPEGNVTVTEYNPGNDPDGDGVTNTSVFLEVDTFGSGYPTAVIRDAETSGRRTSAAPPTALRTEFEYDQVGNVVCVRNPRGIETHIEYNQLNEVVEITRGADVVAAVTSGQLVTGEGAYQYRTRVIYDFSGRPLVTEVENRDSTTQGVGSYVRTSTSYDILGQPTFVTQEVSGSSSHLTQFKYDASQLLTQVILPEGNIVNTVYDERNLPFMVTRGFGDPDASTVQVDYDLNGNRVRVVDAEDNDNVGGGDVTAWSYDGFDRVVRVTDALGNEAISEYDVASNLVRQTVEGHPANLPGGANVLLQETRFLHDELGRVFQVDQELFLSNGFTTVRPVQLLDENSDGVVTTYREFDALSRGSFVVEDDLEVSSVGYDGASRPIVRTDAAGNTVTTEYDQNSNPVRVVSTEVSGLVADEVFVTHYVYDQLDRLVRATDNAGQTTRFGYDSRDNLVFRSDPEGPLTADPLGLFPGQINGPGNTTTWFYDGVNRQVRQLTDLRVGGTGAGALDLGNAYNPDGQISLSYEFDRNSNVTGIVDDKGNRTRFVYDELDRKVQQINADNEAWTYTYDRDDNVRTVTDPNGTVSTKTYDVLNRLTQVDVARALGVAGTTQETFGYDGLSRMTHSTDNNGAAADQTCDRAYDSLGRLVEERFNGTPVSSVFTGDGKRVSCTYPGGRVITQTFDVIDRVLSVSDAGGVIAASDWIGPGYRELRRVNGNGTTFTFLNDAATADIGYDAVKRITRMRHLLPNGTAFIDREYTYNRANVRTSATRNDDFGMTDAFTYDSAYRVISSAYDQGGTGGVMRDLTSQSYKLDGVGNRRVVDKVSTANGASSEAVAVNEVNEYVSVDGVARTHSDNGNLVDNGTLLFVFDYKNRLVAATDKATSQPVAQYLYYSDNRRAQKTVFATSSTTQFFYDGWQVCEETGASNATYVWNPVYVDELVRMDSGGQQFYAHQNARCDVVAVTDGAGNVVEKRFYDDYGRILDANKQPTVLGATPYGFQGRRFDPETGLYYFRNRYYDPETGRFVQRDPVWDAANVGGQYSFVANGPISKRDPSGLQPGAAIAGAAGGLKAGGPRPMHPATFIATLLAAELYKKAGKGWQDLYRAWTQEELARQLARAEQLAKAARVESMRQASKRWPGPRTRSRPKGRDPCPPKTRRHRDTQHRMAAYFYKGKKLLGVRYYMSAPPGWLDLLTGALGAVLPRRITRRQSWVRSLGHTEMFFLYDVRVDWRRTGGELPYDSVKLYGEEPSCGTCQRALKDLRHGCDGELAITYFPGTRDQPGSWEVPHDNQIAGVFYPVWDEAADHGYLIPIYFGFGHVEGIGGSGGYGFGGE